MNIKKLMLRKKQQDSKLINNIETEETSKSEQENHLSNKIGEYLDNYNFDQLINIEKDFNTGIKDYIRKELKKYFQQERNFSTSDQHNIFNCIELLSPFLFPFMVDEIFFKFTYTNKDWLKKIDKKDEDEKYEIAAKLNGLIISSFYKTLDVIIDFIEDLSLCY